MFRNLARYLFWLLFGILIVLIAVSGFLFIGRASPAPSIEWGITFSHSQARALGLDWKETYLALLDELGARNMRIPIYWDELEKIKDEYDFSSWDWQIDELQKRGGKAILVVGFKLPRWPECRFPAWIDVGQKSVWEGRLFKMLRETILHYKDSPAVSAWQVENEPLFRFGVCPERDNGLLDAELSLVRQLDPSRPIVLTDTGENSFWVEAGKRADVIGSTLYRVVHNSTVGYVRYPYPPIMYARKKMWAQWLFPHERVIFSEVQAEPWIVSPPISGNSIETQYKTMSLEQFRENIEYVRETGFDTAYLWGAEWWWWTKKVAGDERIWNIAKETFSSSWGVPAALGSGEIKRPDERRAALVSGMY